jgi:hypothetical protein
MPLTADFDDDDDASFIASSSELGDVLGERGGVCVTGEILSGA